MYTRKLIAGGAAPHGRKPTAVGLPLLDRILTRDNLAEAWEAVAANAGMPGVDRISVDKFARHWEEHIVRLADDVRGNSYQPSRLRIRFIYRALALRWRRERQELPREPLDKLAAALEKVPHAPDLATLRGLEGAGSKAYFAILRGSLRPEFVFEKRTRRPPRDPANALLSFGYTLLGEAVGTALEVVGLDPYEGFFHADKYGRPALALDLVEEFRGPVADSVALTLINKRMLTRADFRMPESGGVYLNRHGLRIFLREFSDRLQAKFTHPLAGRPE